MTVSQSVHKAVNGHNGLKALASEGRSTVKSCSIASSEKVGTAFRPEDAKNAGANIRFKRDGFRSDWRGGRVVEGTGLENRQAGNRLVGSNPTLSATLDHKCERRSPPILRHMKRRQHTQSNTAAIWSISTPSLISRRRA